MTITTETLTNLRLRLNDLTKGVVGLFGTVRMEQVEDGPNAQDLADNVTSTLEELSTAIDMLPEKIYQSELTDDYGEVHTLSGNWQAINRMEHHIKSINEHKSKMIGAIEKVAQAEVFTNDARAELGYERALRITLERDLQRALGYLDRVNDEANSVRQGPSLTKPARNVEASGERPSVNELLHRYR